ncbi:tail fiber protein [Escherchia phage Stokescottia]
MVTKTVIPTDITKLKNESLNKNNNLSDLADRAAAWLNVRPIGSTPLAGDPVSDYDAVTKRWVENKINTGTVGPTMNGVMNYGVGDFHLRDSRAYIQPYEVVSDGQLLNRADWPELWAYAQMLSPISDAEWLADPHERGKYSVGDGQTTFRVPDRNGVQSGSFKGLFGRGDSGVTSNLGRANESSAPNLTAYFRTVTDTSIIENDAASGAGYPTEVFQKYARLSAIKEEAAPEIYPRRWNFDASRQSSVYGRYGNTDEITPNNFTGVWVIRASGGFVAANTSWSVINADKTTPDSGVVVSGGSVKSEYKSPSASVTAELKSSKVINGAWGVSLTITDDRGIPVSIKYDSNGQFSTSHRPSGVGTGSSYTHCAYRAPDWWNNTGYSAFVPILGGGSGNSLKNYRSFACFGQLSYPDSSNSYPRAAIAQVRDWALPDGEQGNGKSITVFTFIDNSFDLQYGYNDGSLNYIFSKSPICDERLKKNIQSIDTNIAIGNIKQMPYKSYIYKNDENEQVRRGFIAQDLQKIDPQYVREYGDPGREKTLAIDENVMLLDSVAAIKWLINKVEELQEEINILKAK